MQKKSSVKMSQSGQKPGRSKGKSKADSFVWTYDEVELLRKVTIEYKVSKTLYGSPRESTTF